ncbi:hypothetical protein [Streptomyces fagopyri]
MRVDRTTGRGSASFAVRAALPVWAGTVAADLSSRWFVTTYTP